MQTKKIAINSTDHQSALNIRKSVFVIEQNIPEEIEVDQYEMTSLHFLTSVDGVPAATGRLRVKDQFIKFERIACLKQFRGTGVGRHLMQKMLEYALENYPHLTPYMHSREDAVAFYVKLGWLPQGDIFYDVNIPHRAMIYKKEN